MTWDENGSATLSEVPALVSERQDPRREGAMLTCAQVAVALAVSSRFVYEEIAAGQLHAYRFGVRAIRVAKEDLAAYVARCGRASGARRR